MQRDGVRAGKAIQKRTGRTFYLATRFLPDRVREPTHVLYAFFRTADEIVDDPGDLSPAEQAARLESLRTEALGEAETDDPVVAAFRELRFRHDIDDGEVHAFVDAMKADIDTDRYETYDELEAYMRGSAAAVGVMMMAIMDLDPETEAAARPHAIALGEAFQLTNFLRDVREDVRERGRIYLPRETLRRHGATFEQVERLEPTDALTAAVAAELVRTERRYREGVAGIRYLPSDCQLPVLLAAVLYAEHHRHIRAQNYDVLSERPSLSTVGKLRCLASTRWHWHWTRDPVAVFRRVSAVPAASREPGTEHGDELPT